MKRIFLTLILLPMLCFSAFSKDITLSNSRVSLVFEADGKAWNFRSFTVDGKNILPDGGTSEPVWLMSLRGPHGEAPSMHPRWTYFDGGSLSDDGRSATFVWRIVLEREAVWRVKVSVCLPDDGSLLPEWRIEAKLPEGWKVFDMEFPRISVRKPEGAKGIMAVGYGAEYSLGNSGMIQSRYPSCTGGMQLIMAHNGKETLFFSSRDKDACMKYFQILCSSSSLTFVQKFTASYAWTSEDGEFSLPWATVLGYKPDTWENTVLEWYRPFALSTKWGEKSLKERHVAPWIQNADVWMRPSGVTPETMESVRKSAAYFGKGLGLHWYYWHCHPFDSYYPEYFPPQEGFKDMVAEAQSLGCHVTPYINGRLWDSATDSYIDLKGYEASCRKADGTLYTEIYSSKVLNTVTCPSSEIWQNVLRNLNSRILEELGTDGVYMDQIGCAASEACYAPGHSHPMGGGGWWPEAYRGLLTGMRDEIYTSDKAMTTEENVECYIDLFDMMLTVNGPHTAWAHMVPLFPLIYSDRCIYSGFTYIPWKLNDGSFRFIQMKSLLWGSQLGWVDPNMIFKPENEVELAFLRNLGEFRKRQHDLFLGGRFVREFVPEGDNPVIDVPGYQKTNVVMGAEWASVKGKKAVILVNMSGEDREVALPCGKKVVVKAYSALRK
ncbi:MAG: DUF6259 domain-containing protein [Bacteroidales bacterium]|nr:DUF6259 domain-containing protein [Bacteroidales bacterium]